MKKVVGGSLLLIGIGLLIATLAGYLSAYTAHKEHLGDQVAEEIFKEPRLGTQEFFMIGCGLFLSVTGFFFYTQESE